MLCYVMLCYVMLCYVMLCYVMLCYVMLCYVMLCYVMLCYVMLCYVMLCYVMLCYVMLCYVMLCYVMLCYVMLCYVMLCYVMLCYVNSQTIVRGGCSLLATSAKDSGNIVGLSNNVVSDFLRLFAWAFTMLGVIGICCLVHANEGNNFQHCWRSSKEAMHSGTVLSLF